MNKTYKLALTGILIAVNIVLSSIIVIPIGPVRAAPLQHIINVICAVTVGPWYGLAQAFISALLRNMTHTGSPFAFPGSMIGVLLASIFYIRSKKLAFAALGEWIGTGFIGSICTLPLMYVMNISFGQFMPIFYAFLLSSLIGSIIAYVILKLLFKRKLLK